MTIETALAIGEKIISGLFVVFVSYRLWDIGYQKSVTRKAAGDASNIEVDTQKKGAEVMHILTETVAEGADNLIKAYQEKEQIRELSKKKDAQIAQNQADISTLNSRFAKYEGEVATKFSAMDKVIEGLHKDKDFLERERKAEADERKKLRKEFDDYKIAAEEKAREAAEKFGEYKLAAETEIKKIKYEFDQYVIKTEEKMKQLYAENRELKTRLGMPPTVLWTAHDA